ncbi:MAG: hypothetical protein U0641_02725 [Anaerolineae bacterium]
MEPVHVQRRHLLPGRHPVGVFYPPNLVMLLAAAWRGGDLPIRALYLQVALHLFLAGAFTYAFARRRLGHRPAALLAAIVFACGGYLTSYPPLQLAVLQTDAWLPLLLLLIDIAVETPSMAVSTGRSADAQRRHPRQEPAEVGATTRYRERY